MGNVGPEKLLLLFVVALIVLGPSKLPEAARTMGKILGEFRRISGGFQAEMRDALFDPVASTREAVSGTLGGSAAPPGVSGSGAPGRAAPPLMPLPDDPTLN
jgi:sec-independent protein translocase protein TatB